MSADVRVVTRPLLNWPGELRRDGQRKDNPFGSTHTDTMNLLKREARMLRAREVVIQIAITEAEIRLDGEPYARAKAKHPGCTVVLPESAQGRISWSTDRYRGGYGIALSARLEGWQVNLRAIALSMEALRAADRHGVMQGRQYAGFREIGSGIEAPAHVMTVEDAARFIAQHVDTETYRSTGADALDLALVQRPEIRAACYRAAARLLHPDSGGDAALFARLQEAREVLEQHG